MTLFLFTINRQGRGEFISAGHNPVYLFRSATGGIEELQSGGLILGAFDFASYQSAAFELADGDSLVVYSDGVTEAEDPTGEMLGEERLKTMISQEAVQEGPSLGD